MRNFVNPSAWLLATTVAAGGGLVMMVPVDAPDRGATFVRERRATERGTVERERQRDKSGATGGERAKSMTEERRRDLKRERCDSYEGYGFVQTG
ncbi:hypothetical protein L484_008817 [Morus notabilis]|uniref:Uncharacterized protein n=1 Tax=Morus notabilis TaxID=981085 RepID=W9QV69_9ROSA|nr:hypothetical protein L484_008817 [Morus notabilis]